MKKTVFYAIAISAALLLSSCYTNSNYEEQEDEDTLQLKEEQEDEDSLQLKNIAMKKIEEGSFKLGDDTKTVSSFYMAETETTQKLYNTIMESNPSEHSASPASGETQENRPVENVSFYQILVFCNKLSVAENLTPVYQIKNETDTSKWGNIPTDTNSDWDAVKEVSDATGFRLPHQDEWVFAALGSNASTTNGDYSNFYAGCIGTDNLGTYAWYKDNSNNTTHDVAKKTANSNGLYDMSGNVWEILWDSHSEGHMRVGGSFEADPQNVSANWGIPAKSGYADTGFRVVCAAN